MKPEELERDIRRNPTMNERFLLGLLDEALGKQADAWDSGWAYGSRGREMPYGDRAQNPYRKAES